MPEAMVNLTIEWGDAVYADAKVTHGDHEWPVHRLVLGRKCKYFEKAFSGRFKEGQNNTIDLTGTFTPIAIERLLQYFYGFGYPGTLRESLDVEENLEMFRVGHYFDIPELLREGLDFAELSLSKILLTDGVSAFCEQVQLLFSNEEYRKYDDIQATITKVCYRNIGDLLEIPVSDFHDLAVSNPEFQWNLIRKLSKTTGPRLTTAYDDNYRRVDGFDGHQSESRGKKRSWSSRPQASLSSVGIYTRFSDSQDLSDL